LKVPPQKPTTWEWILYSVWFFLGLLLFSVDSELGLWGQIAEKLAPVLTGTGIGGTIVCLVRRHTYNRQSDKEKQAGERYFQDERNIALAEKTCRIASIVNFFALSIMIIVFYLLERYEGLWCCAALFLINVLTLFAARHWYEKRM